MTSAGHSLILALCFRATVSDLLGREGSGLRLWLGLAMVFLRTAGWWCTCQDGLQTQLLLCLACTLCCTLCAASGLSERGVSRLREGSIVRYRGWHGVVFLLSRQACGGRSHVMGNCIEWVGVSLACLAPVGSRHAELCRWCIWLPMCFSARQQRSCGLVWQEVCFQLVTKL